MSRPGSSMSRQLTLTEELEKLEQSITLTLQEIDSNFSLAHRIVTTSILPLVEQYREHSKAVWEASKFWKQFFEASANVSLSGYEVLAADEGDSTSNQQELTERDETSADYTPQPERDDQIGSTQADANATYQQDESLLDEGTGDLAGSTPRPGPSKKPRLQFAKMESPYEKLRKEMKGSDDGDRASDNDSEVDLVPHQHTTRLPDMSMTPKPLLNTQAEDNDNVFSTRKNKDPLLHRLLDRDYRIQATPHKATGVTPIKWKVKEEPQRKVNLPAWQENSPMSSPEMAIPTLRSAAFMSPVKYPAAAGRSKLGIPASGAPRTPGVSVQTPATAKKTRDVYAEERQGRQQDVFAWESDEDDDIYGGMSPPKTIQFALPPSKLLQTPAREASKRIVHEILMTAGVEPEESSEYSPTIVKMNANISDDTF